MAAVVRVRAKGRIRDCGVDRPRWDRGIVEERGL
jgi:hypothetical protein